MNIKGLFRTLCYSIKGFTDLSEGEWQDVASKIETILDQCEALEQRLKEAKKSNATLLKKIGQLKKAQAKAIRDLKKKNTAEQVELEDHYINRISNESFEYEEKMEKLTDKHTADKIGIERQYAQSIQMEREARKYNEAKISELKKANDALQQRLDDEGLEYGKKALELSKKLAEAQAKIPAGKTRRLWDEMRDKMAPGAQ